MRANSSGYRRSTSVLISVLGTALMLSAATLSASAEAANKNQAKNNRSAQVAEYWSQDRRDAATPRDLVIDSRGLGYLRKQDGSLQPYGHEVAALARDLKMPHAKPPPGGAGPTTFSDMDPASGATIGASHTFSARVTDPDGIRSVSFVIQYPNNNTQSFTPAGSGDLYSITINGFTDGNWSWWIVAKDGAPRGGNTTTSNSVNFTVDTGGEPPPPPPPGGTVTNSEWLDGGAVQTAAGRIYFEMPNRKNRRSWSGYVCSGTAVFDGPDPAVEGGTEGRSIIVTAAHCVYDDANKAFARNVLFIPDQAGTTGSGTDTNCNNDPLGCWVPTFGVVDTDWTTRTFPNNIPWDYAYYVVDDFGAHQGAGGGADIALDTTAGTLPLSFAAPSLGDYTHALGYSYSDDPNFMYCAEGMSTEGADNWWLASCELSGGSSGGPWVQPMGNGGSGPLMSVNSWGYTSSAGMAGPILYNTTASCLFDIAKTESLSQFSNVSDGDAGIDGC